MDTNKKLLRAFDALDRLHENATYTGIDGIDWHPFSDMEMVKDALQTQAELVELVNWLSIHAAELDCLEIIELCDKALARAEGRE